MADGERDVRRPSSLAGRAPIGERELIWMMALLMALNAFGIDAILPALDELATDLGASGNSRQFVVGAYLLAAGLGTLVPGSIADRYGRRPVLFVALGFYIVLSVACALATSFEALVALRAVQGFSAAGIIALPPAIIRDRVGGDRMARMMSLIFVIFLLVPAIAPSVGQGVIEVFGDWRWIFAVMAGAGVAMTAWVHFRLPETLHAEDRQEIRLRPIVRNMTHAVTLRETIGYTLGSALVFGGLFGFINSSQQLIGEAFGAGDSFPLIFAICAGCMAISNWSNSRIVERYGARRVSHAALFVFDRASALPPYRGCGQLGAGPPAHDQRRGIGRGDRLRLRRHRPPARARAAGDRGAQPRLRPVQRTRRAVRPPGGGRRGLSLPGKGRAIAPQPQPRRAPHRPAPVSRR